MSDCSHDCSSCGESCGERTAPMDLRAPANELSSIKKVIPAEPEGVSDC